MSRQDSAETLALQALSWLAANEDLASRAGEAEFIGSVLDFLLMDDAWIMAFCDATGLRYDAPMLARAALPGGESLHWT